ncbi:hypothetical protein EDD17DRAFT_1527513, partial [Pisolithus thermaeus]
SKGWEKGRLHKCYPAVFFFVSCRQLRSLVPPSYGLDLYQLKNLPGTLSIATVLAAVNIEGSLVFIDGRCVGAFCFPPPAHFWCRATFLCLLPMSYLVHIPLGIRLTFISIIKLDLPREHDHPVRKVSASGRASVRCHQEMKIAWLLEADRSGWLPNDGTAPHGNP